MQCFLQYLGKCAFMKRATSKAIAFAVFAIFESSGKFDGKQTRTSRINSPLNLPCAYLNTQGISPSGTPLKRIDDG
ncbi:hypothetical protein T12_12101 [Trichinella patagoniensis]|uniref:Uncharacterized protein n=1 Tax=Trichinella patagoniensis TaxID=990121 RepID=A0A0V0ZLE6_9BILA|nr:hypothetical protein T12_12101 [Trichinella patagoniensis]